MPGKKGKKSDGNNKQDSTKSPIVLDIMNRNIVDEMRESYLDYAMSVITARALPDVRDGLKPVHRRILFTMHEMGLHFSAKFRKTAAVTGEVLGKYHPHSDDAVYDSLVKMSQDFSIRYPLVVGQGNFGSIDGDPPAAMRYTEAKMSRLSGVLLSDLDKDTVEWRPNYDATRKEPVVLPSSAPNLLLNGTLGIAVGMATSIPPHNLGEVAQAVEHLIDNPEASTEDLLEFVKGPDFPTGAVIFNESDIRHAYASGRGGVVVRGESEIMEGKDGTQIIITSLPYRVNKAVLIENIAGHVRDKKLDGIKGLRDESTKDIRIVIDLKGTAHPQKIINYLYKHTALEDTFHFNIVALSSEGVPQTYNLKALLQEFVEHRKNVVVRRTQYDLNRAKEREHILLGLKKALDHISEIIKTIRASKDAISAHSALMKQFKFSDRQARAILEMRLQRLSGLERQKVLDELNEVQKLIVSLDALLKSPKKIANTIKHELKDIVDKFGDERKTRIFKRSAKSIAPEDLVPDEDTVLVLTAGGYIKRTNPADYRKQKRGGVGVVDLNTREEDFVTTLLFASTLSHVLFFSDKGKVYQTKMYDVPEGRRATKGKSIMNFLPLLQNERITSVLAVPRDEKTVDNLSLVMLTKKGNVKRVAVGGFRDVRKSGIIAIKLSSDDELISALFADPKDDCIVTTARGQAVRFRVSQIRETGRVASGVRAIKIKQGDFVVSALRIEKAQDKNSEQFLLTLSQNGYGKKALLKEYKVQSRGGSGIKTMKITPKSGPLMIAHIVEGEQAEIVAISKRGQVIRIGLNEVPLHNRVTQGVRLMRLREGDSIASAVCL